MKDTFPNNAISHKQMKKLPLLLPFLFVLLFLCQSLGLYAQGRSAYQQAEVLRKEQKYSQAISKYNDAIDREPDNYKYYFQRGRSEFALKKYAYAKISFEKTIRQKPNFASGYAWLAKSCKKLNLNEEAIMHYEQAAEYETNKPVQLQYYLLLVNLLLEEEKVDKAREVISDAEQLAPQNENILYFKGKISEKEKRWEDAKNYYERGLASEGLKGASAGVKAKFYYGLGLAKNELGDKEGAKEAWEKAQFGPFQQLIARQKAQTGPAFNYRVALSYYFSEEYEASEIYADKVIEDKRDFSGAYVLKAKIADKKGQTQEAIQHYKIAIQMEKDPAKKAKVQMDLAELHLQADRPASALRAMQEARASEARLAKNSKFLAIQARAEYKSGQFTEAINTLEMLLLSKMDSRQKAKYSFLLGMAAKNAGELEKARKAFENALYGPYKPAAELELKELE